MQRRKRLLPGQRSCRHRRVLACLAIAASALTSSCRAILGPEPDIRHDTLSIPLAEERSANDGRVRVRFVTLVSDSRCPANAVCVWEGDASVRLLVRVGGTTRDTVLHTFLEPRSLSIGRYVITITRVLPYPGTYPENVPPPRPTVLVSIRTG